MQRRLTALAITTIAAMTTGFGLGAIAPATAQTCASQCSPVKPIQFQTGQRIEVVVENRTRSKIMMENTQGDRAIELQPGQKIKFYRGGSTDPNLAVAFWETTETPLSLALSKPKPNLLQIEVRFARQSPGDRALYITNDGTIQLL